YLYKGLQLGQTYLQKNETNPNVIINVVKEFILNHTSAEIDYIDLLTYPSLERVDLIEGDIILAGEIKFPTARLIDNLILTSHGRIKRMEQQGGDSVFRTMMKAKIHRARVTEADLNYVGSVTIDRAILETVDILPHEKVQIVNNNNGARLETYVIPGEKDSGVICLNGAAARLV